MGRLELLDGRLSPRPFPQAPALCIGDMRIDGLEGALLNARRKPEPVITPFDPAQRPQSLAECQARRSMPAYAPALSSNPFAQARAPSRRQARWREGVYGYPPRRRQRLRTDVTGFSSSQSNASKPAFRIALQNQEQHEISSKRFSNVTGKSVTGGRFSSVTGGRFSCQTAVMTGRATGKG